MIRVIVEHKAKNTEELVKTFRKLRNEAMLLPGYVTGETLVSNDDPSTVLIISTWRSAEDWNSARVSAKVFERLNDLLLAPPKVKIYRYSVVRPEHIWSTHVN